MQAPVTQAQLEVLPLRGALAIGHLHGQYLPPAVPVDADRDQHRLASNHAAFAHFLVAGIKDQIRERLAEAALGKGRQAAIELLVDRRDRRGRRSEEHTSELQSLMRISYAVFCLKKTTHRIPNIA